MSGLPYSNMRRVIQSGVSSQYGVGTPFSGASPLAASISPIGASLIGSTVGFGLNLLGTGIQNSVNEAIYNSHYSPAARMREMRAAGINPNAAANGISESSASEYGAASMSEGNGVASNITDLLGGSVNSEVNARNINANTRHTEQLTEREKVGTLFDSASFKSRLEQIASSNRWNDAQTEQMRSFIKYADDLYYWNARKAEEDVRNAKKQWEVFESEIGLNEKQGSLYDAETGEAKARTSKVWKEVEFDKWYNQYCIDNNMKPDSPDAEYIRHKLILENAPRDSQEYKDAEKWLNVYERSIKDIQSAESAGQREGSETPQNRLALQYESEFKSQMFQLDELENHIRYQLYSESDPKKRKRLNEALFDVNHQRKVLTRRYRRNLRKINSNSSVGLQVAGTGADVSL